MAPSIMDSLFQRSLDDLIRSLRSPGLPFQTLLTKSTDEIRRELKSTDLAVKSVALQKLTYLSSLYAVDMSFAAFHVVELMSSPQFSHKKIAYLAGSQSFHQSTDVLLLIPNQLRKDLTSPNPFESSLALEFLSVAGTHDLARELTHEIFTLLSSAKTLIRKRAIAVLLKFYAHYPDSVRITFKRLVGNLDNSDPNVLAAVIGVFCELTSKDPKSYLPLAPEFYRVLTDCKNNWVLIKTVKIFGRLAPIEPRLAKRVVDPICEIMQKTGAKSLMYECVRAVVCSLMAFDSAVKLAAEKIRELLMEDDPNLKYLGLQALGFLGENHLWAIVENKEIIVKSLSDGDPNIRLEALRLLMAMVSDANVEEISRILVNYALKSDPEFCNEILGSILTTCSRNVYEVIVDFDWYASLLGEMARIPHCRKGDEIERQIVDIGLRVKDVRPELVRVARELLIDPALLGNPNLHQILASAAWVSGEYVEFSKNPRELIEALLQPRTSLLPPLVRAVYIQSSFKVLIFCLRSYFEDSELKRGEVSVNDEFSDSRIEGEDGIKQPFSCESVADLLNLLKMAMEPLLSDEVEVQERASNVFGVIKALEEAGIGKRDSKAYAIVELIHDAFCEELGPVAANAQERVPVPDGLVLQENLADLDDILGDDFALSSTFSLVSQRNKITDDVSSKEPSAGSTSVLAEHRKRHGLYYLPTENDENHMCDYPPANDAPLNEATEDLVRLTDKSMLTKKLNRVKSRPVVVNLGEVDEASISGAKVVKDANINVLSGAVRDILLGDEMNPPDKSSRARTKDKSLNEESVPNENLGDQENSRSGTLNSRKSRHRSHGTERLQSHQKNEDKETNIVNKSRKSSHRRDKHKSRNRADAPLTVTPQVPVIQDFLL